MLILPREYLKYPATVFIPEAVSLLGISSLQYTLFTAVADSAYQLLF